MDSAIKSKLQTLLRLGLVSQNNVRRAMTMFQDPEKYSKSPAYRTLMQELMVDVVDKIVNNRAMYTALRSSLTKDKGVKEADETIAATTQKIGESVETDRTTTLLRSGLVDKTQITAARKALKSKSNLKQMSMGKVYREMMINMLDSLVKKITGSPALFNAFKFTMGKEGKIEEAFDGGDTDIIALFDLHEDAQEILEANKPTNPSLWSKAKSMARSKFDVYPSAYANGWAVKWYNSKGGGWKSVSEGKTFFQFANDLEEAIGSEVRAKLQGLKKDYAKHSAEISKPVPPARGSTNPLARQDTKSGKMYWAADRRKKSGTGSKRASDADYRSDSVSESKTSFQFANDLEEALTPARKAVIDRERKKASETMNRASTPTPERNKAYARGSRVNYLELKGLANKSDKQGSDYQVNKREHAKWRKTEKSMKEETQRLDEVSPPDMEHMTGSKNAKASFTKQYGKRGKSVMYATAWKLHNKNKKKREVKEEIEQIDELSKATKDSYVAKRGSQLSSMMYGSGKHYASLTGRQQKNAVKGIKRATGVKEEAEQIDELSKKTLASYVQKAHDSQSEKEFLKGHSMGKKYQAAREAEKRGVSTPPSKKTPLDKKYKNREMGIGRALKRLQKD
jgi:hypothetical protein